MSIAFVTIGSLNVGSVSLDRPYVAHGGAGVAACVVCMHVYRCDALIIACCAWQGVCVRAA